jgi:mannosyltransferase OCH1-like enzyme
MDNNRRSESQILSRKHIIEELYGKYYTNGQPAQSLRIPKIIHQIWLGSPFPDKYRPWQETWKKFHPGWEYRLWTDREAEKLELINRRAYDETKNFGAKADILRLEIIHKFGGLYADTDFECLKSFEEFHRVADFYVGTIELENGEPVLLTSLFGAIPKHPIIKKNIDKLSRPINTRDPHRLIQLHDGPLFTECFFENCLKNNLVNIAFPPDFFYPYPAGQRFNRDPQLVKSYFTANTRAVHYWEVSWDPKRNPLEKFFIKILPVSWRTVIKKLINY